MSTSELAHIRSREIADANRTLFYFVILAVASAFLVGALLIVVS